MDDIFPINKRQRTRFTDPLPRGWVADKCVKEPPASLRDFFGIDAMVGDDANDWEEDPLIDDYLLAGILELEKERERVGILGRWPFWQIHLWAIAYPERAEQASFTLVIAVGVTLGVLWHVLFSAPA